MLVVYCYIACICICIHSINCIFFKTIFQLPIYQHPQLIEFNVSLKYESNSECGIFIPFIPRSDAASVLLSSLSCFTVGGAVTELQKACSWVFLVAASFWSIFVKHSVIMPLLNYENHSKLSLNCVCVWLSFQPLYLVYHLVNLTEVVCVCVHQTLSPCVNIRV